MNDVQLENILKYLRTRGEKKVRAIQYFRENTKEASDEDKCPCTVENEDEMIEKSQLEYRATHESA
jgi:hypothetical protein